VPPEAVFDQAVEKVADGNRVDWDVSESGALNTDERESLKWLKVLNEIAALHRSTHESFDELDGVRVAPTPSPSAVAVESVASTWGRYQLVEKVGEGSFGSVYRAWDPKLERQVALKILHPHIADTGLTERLVREGRALARVRHINVVSVFDVESHEGRVGLCMDFVRGQTLEGVLRTQGTFGAMEAALVGQDVCRALGAVHQAGLVHRDIKAKNVMREETGRIVLMDFGTGREVRALQEGQGHDMSGTPLYMAPEVLDGAPASIQSDIYSVGVLLYYLVTSEYPVTAASLERLRAAHREGPRRSLAETRPDLPMPLVRVIEQALAANTHDRFPSTEAMLEALGIVTGETESRGRRLVRRLFKASVAFICAMVVLLALGLLNSAAYSLALDRGDFATETVWDWWVWGFRASILPLALLAVTAMSVALLMVVERAAASLWPAVGRAEEAVRRRGAALARRLSLNDASVLGSWILALSAASLISTWWYFRPLLVALVTKSSLASPEQLTLLSPSFEFSHNSYRQTLCFLSLATLGGWYVVMKVASRRRQRIHGGMLAAGMAVLVLILAFLYFPYRLLLKNEFEAVTWNGTECYLLGERSEDALLFCPDLAPPRSRVVRKSGNLQRLGRVESIFTKFSPGAGGGAPGQDAPRD
jgi:hypothetical protein